MLTRGQVIGALVAIEFGIVFTMVVAVRGGVEHPRFGPPGAEAAVVHGARLAETGQHHVFAAGAHPALAIDIGYADLTIVARDTPDIDVAVSPGSDFGFLRAREPIVAREDAGTVRITRSGGHGWAFGDDRRVTVVIPPQTEVSVESAGDTIASGLRAPATLTSRGSGTVTVEDYDAPTLRVTAANGRILLHHVVAPQLDASSTNGRVEGTALRVRDGTVESRNGRVTLGFAPGSDTTVNASESGGRDERAVRFGTGAGRLDVRTGGTIDLHQDG